MSYTNTALLLKKTLLLIEKLTVLKINVFNLIHLKRLISNEDSQLRKRKRYLI